MLPRLKAIIQEKGFDVVKIFYDTGQILLKSGEVFSVDKIRIIRATGQYECTRYYDDIRREIFEGDTIEWVDDRYFKKRKGIVHWYAEKGYFGVEVQDTEDIILLCQIARPDIISRAYED